MISSQKNLQNLEELNGEFICLELTISRKGWCVKFLADFCDIIKNPLSSANSTTQIKVHRNLII